MSPALFACVLAAAPLQDALFTHTGPGPDSGLGYSVAILDDVDGDGTPDVLLGTMGCISTNANFARVYSGATGALLRQHAGTGCYGMSVTGLCDVDGDGVGDYAVSAIREDSILAPIAGRVHVYSGSTGETFRVLEGDTTHARFGLVIEPAGDLDGDGACDLLVTSPWDSSAGDQFGSVDVVSVTTGATLVHVDGEQDLEWLGFGAGALGDVNGDGVPDLAVGSPRRWYDGTGTEPPGFVTVHSGANGDPLWRRTGLDLADHYGTAVAGIGDVDGDGVDDVAAGAPRALSPGSLEEVGTVELLSGVDGSLIDRWSGSELSKFGTSVEAAGDFDGDGVGDVLVGACFCQNSGSLDAGPGYVELRSGATGAVLATFADGAPNGSFGYSSAGGVDLSGDGVPDVVVGSPFDGASGWKAGAAWVYSGGDLALTADGHELSLAAGGTQTFQLDAGPLFAGQLYLLLGSFAGTSPGLPLGALTLPLVPDAYFLVTAAHPNTAIHVDTFGSLDGEGRSVAGLALPAGALSPASVGLVVHHAYCVLDPAFVPVVASNAVPLVLSL